MQVKLFVEKDNTVKAAKLTVNGVDHLTADVRDFGPFNATSNVVVSKITRLDCKTNSHFLEALDHEIEHNECYSIDADILVIDSQTWGYTYITINNPFHKW